eukprot:scaffold22884_cov66-Phaeocystis_antarctica.AAC.3
MRKCELIIPCIIPRHGIGCNFRILSSSDGAQGLQQPGRHARGVGFSNTSTSSAHRRCTPARCQRCRQGYVELVSAKGSI